MLHNADNTLPDDIAELKKLVLSQQLLLSTQAEQLNASSEPAVNSSLSVMRR